MVRRDLNRRFIPSNGLLVNLILLIIALHHHRVPSIPHDIRRPFFRGQGDTHLLGLSRFLDLDVSLPLSFEPWDHMIDLCFIDLLPAGQQLRQIRVYGQLPRGCSRLVENASKFILNGLLEHLALFHNLGVHQIHLIFKLLL